jgi:hypothetical protein
MERGRERKGRERDRKIETKRGGERGSELPPCYMIQQAEERGRE